MQRRNLQNDHDAAPTPQLELLFHEKQEEDIYGLLWDRVEVEALELGGGGGADGQLSQTDQLVVLLSDTSVDVAAFK